MNDFLEKERNPWKSLIILLGLTLICAIAFQVGALLLGMLFTETSISVLDKNEEGLIGGSLALTYFMLGISLLGTFLAPSLLLQKIESERKYFPNKDISNLLFYVLAGLVLVVFGPLMGLLGEWNANMSLPEAFKGVEEWMRAQEDDMAVLTEKIVMVDSWSLFAINMLVMAVVPAVAEEFFFRGALMDIIQRMVKNYHITIWLTAIIFSFMHFQFYGFVPRMILGVFFGYMFVWTSNIWIPVFAHFVNNATVTAIAFYYTRQGKTFEDMQSYDSYSIFVYLGSFIMTIAIGYVFYIKSKDKGLSYGEGLDKD